MYWIDESEPVRYTGTSRQVSFYMDSDADVSSLPGIDRYGVQQGDDTVSCKPVGKGSSALSIDSSTLFFLNSNDQWKPV